MRVRLWTKLKNNQGIDFDFVTQLNLDHFYPGMTGTRLSYYRARTELRLPLCTMEGISGGIFYNKIIFGYIHITLPKEIIEEGLACWASRRWWAGAHALMVTLPSTALKSRQSSRPTLWCPRLGWRPFDDRVDPNGRRGRCWGAGGGGWCGRPWPIM